MIPIMRRMGSNEDYILMMEIQMSTTNWKYNWHYFCKDNDYKPCDSEVSLLRRPELYPKAVLSNRNAMQATKVI